MTTKTQIKGTPVDKNKVLPPEGRVEATITHNVDKPRVLGDIFNLKEGETMQVPAGTAYMINSTRGWMLSQFYETGSMTGPLTYSEVEIEAPKECYRKSVDSPDNLQIAMLGLVMIFFLLVGTGLSLESLHAQISIGINPENLTTLKKQIIVFPLVAAAIAAGMFAYIVGPRLGGDRRVIRSLKKLVHPVVFVESNETD